MVAKAGLAQMEASEGSMFCESFGTLRDSVSNGGFNVPGRCISATLLASLGFTQRLLETASEYPA